MLPLATEWVLANGMRASDLPPSPLAVFPQGIGRADVVFHPLRQGAFILDVRSHFHIPVTVEAKVLFEQPILAMRLPSAGRARLRNGRATLEESAERWTLSLMDESTCRIDNPPDEAYGALVSIFTLERLREMLEEETAPAPIRGFMEGRSSNLDAEVRTSERVRHLLGSLRENPYGGAMAHLYREGLVYQLVAAALDDFAGAAAAPAHAPTRDRRRALAARDILMADLFAPPTIEDLARQVGTSQRRLADAFRAVFGASPLRCLTLWRLDLARTLLASGELSVKQVALLMGYAHVSSFTHAYVRLFGHSPIHDRLSS